LAEDQATLIKQVKEANDIVDVVGSYIPLRPAGPTFKGLCPFHDDHRPSFDVDPRRQRFRCWSCNKYGDVITFVQEHERVGFLEAVEVLARRAGISLEKKGASRHQSERALMLDTVRWAALQFKDCLQSAPVAEAARLYLGERRLSSETIQRFGVGYAPAAGDWLTRRAGPARISLDLLDKVGLVAQREQGGYYDRFRDRVMFPIRDSGGRTVGFGGRILPTSPYASRAPKYYNSADTPLFTKSEHLFGIDLARQAAAGAGYLAVVEGYTDVLMAHQQGLAQVVATMGTALNGRHVRQLRRFVPRVVLVFDADAGGVTGVDRALEIFASEEVDLQIATLPSGMDPCDLLVEQGPDAFRAVLERAVDALEFKLTQVLSRESAAGVEGKRRAVDAVLGVIALAPELPGQAGDVKRELMMTRIAQRLVLKEETLWARLDELRRTRRRDPRSEDRREPAAEKRAAPPAPEERQLLQLLLADPQLVPMAAAEVAPEHIQHPGLRCLLDGLYRLQAEGNTPELDQLRVRIDNPPLLNAALQLQEVGRTERDRPARVQQLLEVFRKRRVLPIIQELHNQLHAATDHDQAVELLRRLQEPTGGLGT
jgi:DNA primase